nr:uncharacterized protein LOC109618338 [Crassostrea gigas]
MASLNSIFESVGRATSTPRVNVNPSQGARSKLLSRSRQSTSPPVERVIESEREHINTQISDLEKALQDLTSDYQRCRAELEQTIRRRRHISFARMADVLQLSVEREEMEELFGTSFPKEWPSDGQACSIPSCPSGEHVFHKIGSYRAHFIKFHKEFVPVYNCPKEGCSFRAFKISPIRKHWDKKHPGLQGCILCRNIKNPRYCDPGQIDMPLPTIHRDARDRAAEARRRASASSTPLFKLPTCYNARDMKPLHF